MWRFQFESVADFLAMNGHGGYVWASYVITFFALILLVVYPIYQQRRFFKESVLREQRIQRAAHINSSDSKSR